jgi:hypothetical protein
MDHSQRTNLMGLHTLLSSELSARCQQRAMALARC